MAIAGVSQTSEREVEFDLQWLVSLFRLLSVPCYFQELSKNTIKVEGGRLRAHSRLPLIPVFGANGNTNVK